MQFANPTYLPLIATAVALLVLFFLAVMKRRATLIKRFADKNLISQIAPSSSIRKKWAKMIMLIVAAGLFLLALARPQWGFEWQETKMVGLDILLAIDVSKSMLARDIKPNRLERSKFAVKDLVKKIKSLVTEKKNEEAKKLLPSLYKALDKASKTGVVKKNTASRRKSRITKSLSRA